MGDFSTKKPADLDGDGPAVLDWSRTVQNQKEKGGAELVPELIHNRWGAGSHIAAVDLSHDGAERRGRPALARHQFLLQILERHALSLGIERQHDHKLHRRHHREKYERRRLRVVRPNHRKRE
jgi:hypothetical protein